MSECNSFLSQCAFNFQDSVIFQNSNSTVRQGIRTNTAEPVNCGQRLCKLILWRYALVQYSVCCFQILRKFLVAIILRLIGCKVFSQPVIYRYTYERRIELYTSLVRTCNSKIQNCILINGVDTTYFLHHQYNIHGMHFCKIQPQSNQKKRYSTYHRNRILTQRPVMTVNDGQL